MKTYALSLKRVSQRYNYINEHLKKLGVEYELIEGVDGMLLTDEQLNKECDMEAVNAKREWLSNGMLACAMSHYNIYQKIVNENIPCAFIVEDDASLPDNILELLDLIEPHLHKNEVLMLYYISFNTCLLSTKDAVDIGNGYSLNFPLNPHQPICTGAYIVTQDAARTLVNFLKPFRVAPDSFGYMFDGGAFETFRLLYPQVVTIKNFKSTIGYQRKSLLKKISNLIDDFKIPGLYQYATYRRKKIMLRMTGTFKLTDEKSPIAH